MPATFTPTRSPLATPSAKDPEVTDSISFAGNLSGPELGSEQVFAEFVANANQLEDWSKEADGGEAKMKAWLVKQVDERYSGIVRERANAAPPAPPPEPVPMKDLARLFGTKPGKTPVLTVESTHIDRGTDPAEEAEEQGKTRSLFKRRKADGEEKGGKV